MYNDDYLMHYGIKGMKWGVRRYQNADGTLTPAGKKRIDKAKNFQDKIVSKAERKTAKYDKTGKKSKNPYREMLDETGKKNYDILHANDVSSGIKGGLIGASLPSAMLGPATMLGPGGTAVGLGITSVWGLVGASIASNAAQNKIIKSSGETEAHKFKAMQHLESRITATKGERYVNDKFMNESNSAKASYTKEQHDRNAYYTKLFQDIANEKMKPGKDYTYENFHDGATEITRIRSAKDGSLLYDYRLTTHYY